MQVTPVVRLGGLLHGRGFLFASFYCGDFSIVRGGLQLATSGCLFGDMEMVGVDYRRQGFRSGLGLAVVDILYLLINCSFDFGVA